MSLSLNIQKILNSVGRVTIGKVYTVPVNDNDAAPKKYVDDAITSGLGNASDILDLKFKSAYSSYYHENTYNSSGDLTGIGIWENNTKTVSLFTVALVYTSGNLLSSTLTDIIEGDVLTKTFAYDSNGNLSTINRVYT
jgi:hypothetical protein